MLEDWCYASKKIASVKEKILADIGPAAGSVRVKWVQHIFAPFSHERVRKLHFHRVGTHCRTPETLETLLGGMSHFETVILHVSDSNSPVTHCQGEDRTSYVRLSYLCLL